jgi:NAD(P)-dependent dehydrogenase (short-subunit alcohol dehydrogenase family)
MTALDGKVALVTGAASGIGRATARALAAAGASVTSADVSDAAGEAAAAEIGATYAHLDVSDPAAWSARLDGFERLDLLHLNAGIYDVARPDILSFDDASYRRYLGVNVDGVFFGLRGAVPLLERANGAVVVTASMAGVAPLPANPVYALTKYALVGLVRSVADDLFARGVRINAVCPGAVATPLMGDDTHGWFAARDIVALEPEDLAATVVELLGSDRHGEIVLHRAGRPAEAVAFPALPLN